MNCTVIRDTDGNIQDVLTQSGDKSNLYYDLLFELNDPEEALIAYATTLTPLFNEQMGNAQLNEQGEHTLDTYNEFAAVESNVIDTDLSSFANEVYLQMNDDVERDKIIGDYANQISNATKEQKASVNSLIKEHVSIKKIPVGDTDYVYSKLNELTGEYVEMTGATTYLESLPRYKFEGAGTGDTKYIDWGNIADDILSGVVTEKTFEEIEVDLLNSRAYEVNEQMSMAARKKLFNYFTEIVNLEKSKGNILLTQVRIGSIDKKIGGTIDLVAVKPNGEIQLFDLKTSVSSVLGNSYRSNFVKQGLEKASKFQKHSAQLSIYSNILQRNGFSISLENRHRVIPILIKEDTTAPGTLGYAGDVEQETQYIEADNLAEFSELFQGKENNRNKETYKRIIATLTKLAASYKQNGNDAAALQLETFLKSIAGNEYFDGMVKIAEDAYKRFLGPNGLKAILDTELRRLEDADDLQAVINQINQIESIINIFSPEKDVSPLADLYNMLEGQELEEGSIGDKVTKVMVTIEGMKTKIKNQVPAVLAKYLVKSMPLDADVNVIKMLDAKRAKVSKATTIFKQATTERQKKKREKELNDLTQDLEDFINKFQIKGLEGKEQPDFEKMIEREIKDGAFKDITVFDRWVSSIVNMPVGFLSLYALKVKEAFTAVNQAAIKFQYEANEVFQKFTKGVSLISTPPEKLNEGLYETVKVYKYSEDGEVEETKKVLTLTNVIDYNAFYEAKAQMYRDAAKLEGKEKAKFIAKWYAENTQARPQNDYVVNGVTLIESINTVFRKRQEQLGKDTPEYETWYADNVKETINGKEYRNELTMPKIDKYTNSKFKELQNNKEKLEYYSFLVKTYFESQAKQPQRGGFEYEANKFILPFISKSSMDRLTENGIKNLAKYKADDLFKVIDEDYNEVNYDDTNKSVNILYYNSSNQMDAENTSKDLMSSILRYKIAADRYEKRVELAGVGKLLHSLVSKKQPLATAANGNTISFKFLKGKVDNYLEKKTKSSGNNAADMLESFINQQIYGMTKAKSDSKVDANKLTEAITKFAAVTQLGFDVTLSISNSLTANITNAMESAGSRHYGLKEWRDANLFYLRNEGKLIQDSLSPVKTSFLGQLAQLYDAMQGEFYDEYGTKLTKSTLKDKWYKKAAFSGMHKGEHRAQVTSLIALLKRTKVKYIDPTTGNEQMISLLDAYHIPQGKTQIELKEGVVLNNKVGLIDMNVQNKLHSINSQLHGIYNSFEAPELSRHWIGNLMLMYRKFLPAGLKYRFKNEGYNFAVDDFTKGTYRDFYKTLFREPKRLLQALKDGENDLDEWEKANLRKALFEHAMIMVTGALVLALQKGFEDDDDRSWGGQWALYTALRLNSELSTFGAGLNPRTFMLPNVKTLGYSFNQVSVIFSITQKAANLIGTLSQDMFAIVGLSDYALYERDSGFFKKGDSKSLANFLKLIGINNRKILQNPEEAVNILLKER